MSTGVGNVNHLVIEKPLADVYWASKGGVGPGPAAYGGFGAATADYIHTFSDNTNVAAGTGWTWDAAYRCWRIAATPGANSDLVITLPNPPTYTLNDLGCIVLNMPDCSVANAIELRWSGTNPALIAAITGPGTYKQEYTIPGVGPGGVWTVRAKSGIAVVASVKSISWTRPWGLRKAWLAANTGSCT
jgi:hypothetical protein